MLRSLPTPARRLLCAAVLAAAAMVLLTLELSGWRPNPWSTIALGLTIALGELLRVDLPQRGGGNASFGLGDAALTAGLLVLPPGEVTLGAGLGLALLQIVERGPAVKFATNLAQYTAGAGTAAVVVHVLARRPGPIEVAVVGAVILASVVFLAVNITSVGSMIALISGRSIRETVTGLLATGGVVAAGDVGLGIVAVVLWESEPWALPFLAVPVMLLWTASRHDVHARIAAERTAAIVDVEHALSVEVDPAGVRRLIPDAIGSVIGGRGAVWKDGRWITDVPNGSGSCPLAPDADGPTVAAAPSLGIAVDGVDAIAVGLGDCVLVAWPGDLDFDNDTADWVERLARSARVHLERTRGLVELEHERATLGAVVGGTDDGIMLLGDGGRIALWNPAMARLSEQPEAAALGRTVGAVLGEGPWQVDGVHDVRRGASGRVWRISVATVDEHGLSSEGRMRVVAVHDVTAERRAAKAREDMLSVVSHEMRTPLTPIIACAQILRRRGDAVDDDRRATMLQQIEERATDLGALVDDLLLAGRLSAGKPLPTQPHLQPVRVDEIVGDAITALQMSYPGHIFDADAVTADLVCVTDPLRLRQMVTNLLDNAGKYSEEGTTVAVSLAREEDRTIAIRIADQGRGIDPADVERVFDQFVRLEDPLLMTTSGTGLGLFIVRSLAELLGGDVTLESTPGVGTSVTLRLPLEPPAPSGSTAPAAAGGVTTSAATAAG